MTTAQEVLDFSDLPDSCPYTISRLLTPIGGPSATWLIREHDRYGEYPHIYAKVCEATRPVSSSDGHESPPYKVIVLSDSGCGTDRTNESFIRRVSSRSNENENENENGNKLVLGSGNKVEPSHWNIHTFLLYTLNPGGRIPYVVITSHCHYDHISGIAKLPPTGTLDDDHHQGQCGRHDITTAATAATTNSCDDEIQRPHRSDRLQTTVLTSSLHKDFVTPYANLQEHSLSPSVGMQAPKYKITWAEDMSEATWRWTPDGDSKPMAIGTRITLIQTPGHTPDSLSWYDEDLALLSVGDSFYLKESTETRSAPWGPEPPMPTMFDLEGDLADSWTSIEKLLRFVRVKNEDLCRNYNHRTTTNEDEDMPRYSGGCENGGCEITSRHRSTWSLYVPFWSKNLTRSQPPQQPLLLGLTSRTVDDDWVVVDCYDPTGSSSSSSSRAARASIPRVRLAAAHTTVGADAEDAILSFREFLARIIHDQVPKRRVANGFRGEEKWLYDYDLEKEEEEEEFDDGKAKEVHGTDVETEKDPLRYLRQYSVLAPEKVIEKGRKKISDRLQMDDGTRWNSP
ncbi:hypothetical protein LTS17_000530 [Exophiala oligosperma]